MVETFLFGFNSRARGIYFFTILSIYCAVYTDQEAHTHTSTHFHICIYEMLQRAELIVFSSIVILSSFTFQKEKIHLSWTLNKPCYATSVWGYQFFFEVQAKKRWCIRVRPTDYQIFVKNKIKNKKTVFIFVITKCTTCLYWILIFTLHFQSEILC